MLPERKPMQPKIRAVCFDMDGLLFNTEDLFDEVGIEMLAKRGKKLNPEVVRRMMGQQAEIALQIFIDHYELSDTVDDLKQETDEIFDRILPDRLSLLPGAQELLDSLTQHGERPVALTTSSGAQAVSRIMDIINLREHFHFQLTAEDVQNSKPHPEIYCTAAERFDVAPDELLVFEDSENGCRSGVDAGAAVVAIPSKYSDIQNYEGSLFVADTLQDQRIQNLLFS